MPTDRVLEKIREITLKADAVYLSGRNVFVTHPGMTWGGDADENLAWTIEAIEATGWHLEHCCYDNSGFVRLVFRRSDSARARR